jgi:hypothetical protein
MKKLTKFMLTLAVVAGALLQAACTSCNNTSWKSTANLPTRGNLITWKGYLKVVKGDPTKPIDSTMRHITNVSHLMAVAKINQAMQSYNTELGYKLSTVFELTTFDSGEKVKDKSKETERGEPAVTLVSINGHAYYIGMLDYRKTNDTYAEYEQTKYTIPAIGVADAEDAMQPAWIRTQDDDGNPYHIKLRYSEMVNYDDNNIYRHLRNRGYSTSVSCHMIDNPTPEMDDKWRPFFTVSFNKNDGCGINYGDMYWPEKFLIVDMQSGNIKEYLLDDPNTPDKNERDPKLDTEAAWVDQIYSPWVLREYIKAWGVNINNYGKTSQMDDFTLDGGHLDEVMNIKDTNIAFMAYITSFNSDDALIGVMTIDPRTGIATLHDTQGNHAMATKTSAVNAIRQATHRWDYNVEDLTLHTIYGVPTWQGELTRPAVDNEGKEYGSLYCGMVMIQANYDHQPQHVQVGFTKHEVFTKYERWLIRSRTERVGSNVEEIKELTGQVQRIQQLVVDGETNYLINLNTHRGLFAIVVDYLGNPDSEAVLNTQVGDTVYLRYADPRNTQTYIVLEIKNTSKPPEAETRPNEHMPEPVKTSRR